MAECRAPDVYVTRWNDRFIFGICGSVHPHLLLFAAFVPTSTMDSGGLEHDGAASKAHHICSLVCAYRVLKVHSGRGGACRWRMDVVHIQYADTFVCYLRFSSFQYNSYVGNKFVRLDFSVDTEIRIFNRSVLLARSSRVTRVHKLQQHQAPRSLLLQLRATEAHPS